MRRAIDRILSSMFIVVQILAKFAARNRIDQSVVDHLYQELTASVDELKLERLSMLP